MRSTCVDLCWVAKRKKKLRLLAASKFELDHSKRKSTQVDASRSQKLASTGQGFLKSSFLRNFLSDYAHYNNFYLFVFIPSLFDDAAKNVFAIFLIAMPLKAKVCFSSAPNFNNFKSNLFDTKKESKVSKRS